MGAGGFEPPNANARGFTIPALWPLGYTPQDFRLSPSRTIQRAGSLSKATSRTQTEDLQITNQLLYQLS